MSKGIIGAWSWKPRDELPANEVKEKGFPTPTLEAVQFTADGQYKLVRQVPSYDTDVAGTPVEVPEEWHEWKGTWDITKGRLEMHPGSAEDGWLAKRRKNGWVTESQPVRWERAFEIVELKSHELRLRTLASGDFNRTFHRVGAIPERPEVK